MAYTPNKWVDREGITRYFESVDDDGALILTPDYTQVTEMGTPVNSDNMNHIEEGIAAGSFTKYDSKTTYAKDDLVTAIVDGELKVYKSLQDNNNGQALTQTAYWVEVELGGGGGTLNMFDTVLKDHILTYEESKGLALQGTYVYKNAIAGSRYGYPTFYEKCVEEFQNASNTTTYKNSGIAWAQPTNPSGITASSGFSNPSNAFDNDSSTYASCGTTTDYIEWDLGQTLYITGFNATGNYVSSVARACNLSLYVVDTNGNETLIADGTGASNAAPYTTSATFDGVYATKIRFKISTNNEPTTQYPSRFVQINLIANTCISIKHNPNGHQFYNIADKGVIDIFFNSTGRAWMYGVDTENERIFLPRNNSYFRIGDESTVGTNQDAGLPNITGTAGKVARNESITGAFYGKSGVSGETGEGGDTDTLVSFDASRSSKVYGNAVDTVELDSVNMLLYICVGNTESEEALTNVIDITTTENDTLPLLHHIPADELLEHPSWLRSSGQWNDGNVYATVYNYLVNEYINGTEHTDTLTTPDGTAYTVTYKTNKGKKVVDVANAGQVETVYNVIGSAWYYVINQEDMTFRLPMSHNSECYTSDPTRLGLDVSAGLPNIEGASDRFDSNGGWIEGMQMSGAFYSESLGVSGKVTADSSSSFPYYRFGFDASRSNPIYSNSDTVTPPHTEFYLYFKVANAVQNLELLNAGEVLEAVNNVIPNNRTVWDGQWVSNTVQISSATAIGTYTLDLSSYLPDDGFIYEVWGRVYIGRGDSSGTNSNIHIYDGFGDRNEISHTMVDGANFQQNSCQFLATIDTSRTMTMSITDYKLEMNGVYLLKYRRLGTNV